MSKQHKLFWGSSYDRGLDMLLFMWPDIRELYPDAELHITYGWKLFDSIARTNPERMQWKNSVQTMMEQDGVIHHGRVGKDELKKIRGKCGIWAYPTYFTEINCITALETQADGLVPVTMDLAALDETVGAGVKVSGNIRDEKVQKEYLEELLKIMGDKERWEKESKKAKRFAKDFKWSKIAPEWVEEFEKPLSEPRVTVATPTIREGWWNIMADNLSKQTYNNFEWLIVDDYPKDREKIAKKYAKKYDLDIKYIRGDKVKDEYSRPYGLVRANNIAWQQATGELIVWLQDFILIPERGIEDLVTLYRRNPDALLAPTDIYYHCKEPNRKNKEDWWDGDTDIITKESWRNVRNEYVGVRETENPMDFEMNYSAIPKHILEKLNGWWEFFDEGLGFDNTEIAYRALKGGFRIVIDDTNVAKCINLWPHIAGEKQNVENRERVLTVPQYAWLEKETREGNLPLIRNEKLDDKIKLTFKVPKEVKDEKAHIWIEDNAERIVKGWPSVDEIKNGKKEN